ncbi:hypothetical protein MNBD_GAMMA06-1679 [hydrothermal vent metagenome]|uniref:DUF2066 domain-containing protein n=1 Tax=hydrothermal vent metagenome TaxID=652676 RepID=A0A3B0WDW1_9ZZZZ
MPQLFQLKVKIFFIIYALFAFNQVIAGNATALYNVDVLVKNESANTRWGALKNGLDEVFVRISGDSIVMDKLKRPPASRYVKQYSYEPVENPVLDDKGMVLSHLLKIQYDGRSMEKYLRDNAFPVWGEHRADVVIWLAIRDGKNEYVLKSTDQSVIKAAADTALQRRGISERWPLYDSKDKKIIKVADIRGGFKDPIIAASKRYSRGPALTGSLIWNGKKWQSSWSLLMVSGDKLWSIEDADYNSLISKAVDRAADAMGVVFAIHGVGKNQQLITAQLEIQAVNSIKKYRKLENYLQGLSAVVTVKPLKVDDQSAIFEVVLRSSEEDFLNLVKNDAELTYVEPIYVEPTKKQKPAQVSAEKNQRVVNDLAVESSAITKKIDNTTATAKDNTANNAVNPLPEDVTPQLPIYHYKLNN